MSDALVRPMTKADLGAADELRRLAGWNQTPEDWRGLLRLQPRGCFVAVRDRLVVGTVTTTTYAPVLAWIGMMLVHPDHQRQGIGTRLMQQALAFLERRGIPCIKLDATPAGQPLYAKLGFAAETGLTRWQRTASGAVAGDPADTRPLAPPDWAAISTMDARVFGAPRVPLLRALAQLSRSARVWPSQGPMRGWGLVRPGTDADHLGPVVCREAEGALALLAALLSATASRPVLWDILDQNETATAAAHRLGFSPLRPLMRMRRGANSVASEPGPQFAIADPAVG